ncbi:sensor histidine kinase [Streptomyces sp. 891-h]|uniref:sensor histidine kinase n=1 Tax=Streptomyces sp. 891-h TaxID=2720714 RepID=UPI001FAA0353|nr:sensor histidine kinase [Streptomyces sp. 891-h]UNZ18945.1 sensor histidine kinase [Streptomyces sp. 891-h]
MTETGENRTRGGPWWWERPRSAVLDIALGAASAAECALQGQGFAREAGVPGVLAIVLGALAGATLVLRRRWPIAVVLVAIAVIPAEMGTFLGVVGLYTLAATEVPRRITGLLASMAAVGMLVITTFRLEQSIGQDPDFNPSAWFVPLVSVLMSIGVTAPPVLLGLYVGARRRLVESLRERADGLERELSLLADRAEERAEWARNEERTRIAREMHDVVAHRVSLMVVHAAALQAVALKDPEKAAKNAALVGDMGRQALNELRTMLGVLRSGEAEKADKAEKKAGEAEQAEQAEQREQGAERVAGSEPAGAGLQDGSHAASHAAPDSASASASGASAASAGSATAAVRPCGDDAAEAPSRLAEFASAVAGRASAGAADSRKEGARAADEDGAAHTDRSGAPSDAPSLAQLDVLVGQSRAAGMTVELSVEGSPDGACPQPVQQTAYRVVQEALTNVHKHAAGAATRVRVAHRAAEVALQVENDPAAAGAADAGLPSGGNGLVGMRERVTALGGGFVSGPTDAGGFRVSAIIPYARS